MTKKQDNNNKCISLTLKSKPSKIIDEFTNAIRGGYMANLKTMDGFLSVIGGDGGICWKTKDDGIYVFSTTKQIWEGPL